MLTYMIVVVSLIFAIVLCVFGRFAWKTEPDFSNATNNEPAAPREVAPIQEAPPQSKVDLLKSMSTKDRGEFVANLLKTEKYVGQDDGNLRSSTVTGRSVTSVDELDESAAFHNCAICLEQFETDIEVCSSQNLNCEHVFHLSCIFEWLQKSHECPCCRRDYLCMDGQCDVELALPSSTTEPEIIDEQHGNFWVNHNAISALDKNDNPQDNPTPLTPGQIINPSQHENTARSTQRTEI